MWRVSFHVRSLYYLPKLKFCNVSMQNLMHRNNYLVFTNRHVGAKGFYIKFRKRQKYSFSIVAGFKGMVQFSVFSYANIASFECNTFIGDTT